MIQLTSAEQAVVQFLYGKNFVVQDKVERDERIMYFVGFRKPEHGEFYLSLDYYGSPYLNGERPVEHWTGDSLSMHDPGGDPRRLVYSYEDPNPPAPAEVSQSPGVFTVAEISAIIDIYGFFPRPPGYTPVAFRPPLFGELYFNPFSDSVVPTYSTSHEDEYLIFVKDKKKPVAQQEVRKDAADTGSNC